MRHNTRRLNNMFGKVSTTLPNVGLQVRHNLDCYQVTQLVLANQEFTSLQTLKINIIYPLKTHYIFLIGGSQKRAIFFQNFSSVTYKNYQHNKLTRGVCGSKHCGLNLTHAEGSETTALALRDCFNASIYESYGLQVSFG